MIMLAQVLAPYLNVSAQEVERLLSLTPDAIYADKSYRGMVAHLNSSSLQRTSDYAYAAYDEKLPALKEQYGLRGTVMGGYTLCNWILGFLMYPETMPDMLDHHIRVSTNLVVEMLPELISILDTMPEGREEWQRALVVFSLPLLVR